MSEILRIENIDVNHGAISALKGISINIEKGDIVSLIGANGAGKSTLLKALAGQVPLSNGRIIFDGEVINSARERLENNSNIGFLKKLIKPFSSSSNSLSSDQILKRGLCLVPEGRHIFASMTVEENLEMGAFIVKDKKEISTAKEKMYESFPILKTRSNQIAGNLSGGEQQMLAIARAIMSRPKVLLLDEPGLGLAPLMVQQIFDIIKKINTEKDVTIFLVEQNANMALSISNKAYVMEIGKIVISGTGKELLNNDRVKLAYLG